MVVVQCSDRILTACVHMWIQELSIHSSRSGLKNFPTSSQLLFH